MSNCRGHFADLPVFAFDQLKRDPAIGNTLAKTNGRVARRYHCRPSEHLWKEIGIGKDGLRLNQPGPARQGFTTLDHDAVFKSLQFFWRRNPFNLNPILTLMSAAGMQEFLVQVRFIAQQEQPFGIGIEAADGPDIFRKTELCKGAVFRAVTGKLRQHTERLVKCENQGPVRALRFPRNCTARF